MASALTCNGPLNSSHLMLEVFKEYVVRGSRETAHCFETTAPSPPLSPVETVDDIIPSLRGATEVCEVLYYSPLGLSACSKILPFLQRSRYERNIWTLIATADSSCLSPRQKQEAIVVAERLKQLGDELDARLNGSQSLLTTLMNGFRNPDSSVFEHFVDCIKSARNELSCQMIIKLFRLGICLVQSLVPENIYDEHHRRLLDVFVHFLTDELSMWIDEQGGWNNVLNDDLRSQSTPILNADSVTTNTSSETSSLNDEDHIFVASCPSPIIVSRNERSQSVSIPVHSLRQRPATLSLTNNSYGSNTTFTRRGSLRNYVTFGIGISFGFALCTFLFTGRY